MTKAYMDDNKNGVMDESDRMKNDTLYIHEFLEFKDNGTVIYRYYNKVDSGAVWKIVDQTLNYVNPTTGAVVTQYDIVELNTKNMILHASNHTLGGDVWTCYSKQ